MKARPLMSLNRRNTLNRVWSNYNTWEDYLNGMYKPSYTDCHVSESYKLLSNPTEFNAVAKRLLSAWPISSAFNLSNTTCNRQAWTGQASCCFNHGAPCDATKEAWWQLSDSQRATANCVADKVIDFWIRNYKGNYMEERIFGVKETKYATGITKYTWNCPKCKKKNEWYVRGGVEVDNRCCVHFVGRSKLGDWLVCDPQLKAPRGISRRRSKLDGLTDSERNVGQLTLFGERHAK